MKKILTLSVMLFTLTAIMAAGIDRKAVVTRNNPVVKSIDPLASLSVGNGDFAFTVDATGLQTFPETYSKGVPLGTQSSWGWHSFANPEGYKHEETMKDYDFGHGRTEPYATEFKEKGRQREASIWYRMNPHRLHLGVLGFAIDSVELKNINGINQCLDMWKGEIDSRFTYKGMEHRVQTVCHPQQDIVAAKVQSAARTPLILRFPYPTGAHCDDACDWNADEKHSTDVVSQTEDEVLLKRVIDETAYYVRLSWKGKAVLSRAGRNAFMLTPQTDKIEVACLFTQDSGQRTVGFEVAHKAAANRWKAYWTEGGIVDFGHCKDSRAAELERRVVLSQYLMAIQCAGATPPQETGLTYNSWFGKFHLEMIWWHQAQFALWGHEDLLERTLQWYFKSEDKARGIAQRQGFDGVRWMKMTDPSAMEAPSKVGSFLIWQQPHIIYLAELVYRANPSAELIKKYNPLIQETAKFMYDFATYDKEHDRYVLKGVIPAQETLRAAETVNPPFELSYWHYGLKTAQLWRERAGMQRVKEWDEMADKLSVLAKDKESGLYLAAETATETYKDIRFTSDHMAVLGAVGILPMSRLVDMSTMKSTFEWIWDNWNWNKTWGWDYPMTAMNAARMGEPEKAVAALLMSKRTNTYLVNGHNYQDARLRVYLPGNGGLLTTIAMMCAGWDGTDEKNPGFPKDGNWDVRWEGLHPMP